MDREERNKKFEEYLHATPAERRKFDLSFLNEPSLPSNMYEELKKAAEEYAFTTAEDIRDKNARHLGFLAGAEWAMRYQEKKIADAYEKGKQEGIRVIRSWESSPGQGGY